MRIILIMLNGCQPKCLILLDFPPLRSITTMTYEVYFVLSWQCGEVARWQCGELVPVPLIGYLTA